MNRAQLCVASNPTTLIYVVLTQIHTYFLSDYYLCICRHGLFGNPQYRSDQPGDSVSF